MGKPILLLRLEGPLQAWGTRARWDVRDTGQEPTKSGIVGLLGCAFGYARGNPLLEKELDAGLRMGVRVEHPGAILEDFQTITDFLPTANGSFKHSGVKTGTNLAKIRENSEATPSTIISPRQYLEDAAFLVALEETDIAPGLLGRCAIALQNPRWPLYLGRKALIPSRPIFVELSEDFENITEALQQYPWSWLGGEMNDRKQRPETVEAFIESKDRPAGVVDAPSMRQDSVRINAARVYAFRQVWRLRPFAPPTSAREVNT